MRPVVAAFALVLLAFPLVPPAASQAGTGPDATLTIDVQADHSEQMTLQFEGLRRLTRYSDICLPAGARESSVSDSIGPVQYEARDDDGRRVITFTTRDETLTVVMARPAPSDRDRPLFTADANFCVPTDASVATELKVPEGHTIFFVSDPAATVEARSARAEKDGPMHLFYSYEAPLAGSGLEAYDVAPFRVLAEASVATEAQEAARLAVAPFQAALDEAGLGTPFDAIRILYQEETPYAWEAGHYNGHGYVAVKEDTLGQDEEDGWPLKAVKVLVHEAFHAASFPYGSGAVDDKVSWFLEGTAKHSERHVDAALPNATIRCEKTAVEVSCRSFDDRIKRADLETGYSSTFTFNPLWEPSLEQTDDTRTFYYGYSEFVVGAWIARHGVDAYRTLWDEIDAAFRTGAGCPCDAGWLVAKLGDETLFTPWDDVKSSEPERFEANVKPFVQDEAAFQEALNSAAGPLGGFGIATSMWVALVAVGIGALALRRRV